MEKDHKLVCDGKYPICIECPSFLMFAYPLQDKLSSTAKNYALLLSPNDPTELEAENFSYNNKIETRDKTNHTRHKFLIITHKNNCCQVFSRSRNNQPLFVN